MEQRDERLPVVLGEASAARRGDLVIGLPPPSPHAVGCRCCGGRDPLAVALAGAFVDRSRGARPWFERVLVLGAPADAARLAGVLTADPVALARFRAAG